MPTELRDFGELQKWHGAGRLGTHSFRKGAARAMLEVGGSFSQLLRAGPFLLDLTCEESRAIASMMVDASDDE